MSFQPFWVEEPGPSFRNCFGRKLLPVSIVARVQSASLVAFRFGSFRPHTVCVCSALMRFVLHSDSVRFGSALLGSVRFDSVRFGSVRFGSVRFGSVRLGSVRFGSVRFGSVRFGSVRLGSVRFGSVRFGSVLTPS